MDLTAGMVTPRRKWPLPETLHQRDLRRLFDTLPDPRNRLLVALLAGCGLRVSEACRIRWADPDAKAATLRIEDPSGLRSRTVPVPQGLMPMFQGLAAISPALAPMVCGRADVKGTPRGLSVRQMNVLLGRLNMALPALSVSKRSVLRPTQPQGP